MINYRKINEPLMLPDFNLQDYEGFLSAFVDNNYKPCLFHQLKDHSSGAVVLRHDVDFDCKLAYQMALQEYQMNIKSTYFFLVSSEYYNIAFKDNYENIHRTKELGHTISIHFDPLSHVEFNKGFITEVEYFEKMFGVTVDIVSIHLPGRDMMEFDKPIMGIEHAYQSKYCRDIKYFSDSTGIWRFGNPLNSREFMEGQNMQILIHPIWWMLTGNNIGNAEKLRLYYNHRINLLEDHYMINFSLISKVYEQVL